MNPEKREFISLVLYVIIAVIVLVATLQLPSLLYSNSDRYMKTQSDMDRVIGTDHITLRVIDAKGDKTWIDVNEGRYWWISGMIAVDYYENIYPAGQLRHVTPLYDSAFWVLETETYAGGIVAYRFVRVNE